MKTLEDMSDDEEEEEEEDETISSIVNTIVDQIDEQANDEIGLAERIGKRPLTVSSESDTQRLKRLRSNTANANISV
jgi:hypothetical protein